MIELPLSAQTASTERIVQVREVDKSYGAVTAVRGISFEVLRGEVFGVLGSNGAGKTTTLEMIEGMLTPDRGSIQVRERTGGLCLAASRSATAPAPRVRSAPSC